MNTRRVIWKVAHLMGGKARQWAWDDQYQRGVWNGIATGRSDTMKRLIRELALGRVLELGCGEGTLAATIPDTVTDYLGVDVSSVAVMSATNRQLPRCRFVAGDIAEFDVGSGWDLIVIEEALYYLTIPQQFALLTRCVKALADGGSVLIAVHSASTHRATLRVCEQFHVHNRIQSGSRVYLVIK